MMQMRSRRRDGDRGAAVVEFALVLLPLIFVIFGIIDFGMAYNAKQTLNQAARVGARLASVGKADTAVKAAVVDAADPTVKIATTDVTVSAACGTAVTEITVTIDYSFHYPAWIPFVGDDNGDTTLHGKATAPCS